MNNDILTMVINNLRAAMELRDMDEKDFCKAVGVSDRYLSQKRDDIGIVRLISMCQILNIKPENVLDEGYATEARKEALRGEIERLKKELNRIDTTPVKK